MHPAAERELNDVVDYYDATDPDLADAFVDTFDAHLAKIFENPLQYNIRRRVVRRVNLLPQFGEYYLPFMMWNDRVIILAVAHAKRRPYYWRRRIGEARKLF